MLPSDLDFAVACTTAEGWGSETRPVFEGFLAHDPAGCFVAEAEDERVGICIAASYQEYGFVGELIVVEERRGRGIGRRLLEHAVLYLRSRGAQNILLDGVPAAVPLYERVGFRRLCRSLRFMGTLQGRSHPRVRAMQAADLKTISQIDQAAFGADRRFFLERRLALYPELCKVLEGDGEIASFIMGQRMSDAVSVGPWVVQRGIERPGDLLESLAAEVGGDCLNLGILETNSEAVATVRSFGFVERPNPSWRMVLGPSGELGSSTQSYAIGSAAKG
jgi:GNAT superfamily N-acetyltransferase